jgi:uncharacterized protein YqeY
MNAEKTALWTQIDQDLHQAMRAQDNITKLTLRAVKTALTESAKSGADHALTDEDVVAVVQREAKRRRESAAEYVRFGSEERAAQELAELAVLERYLPKQLSEAEIEAAARAVIAAVGADNPRDLGKVMPVLLGRLGGAADGKVVSGIVRRLLGA